MIFGSKTPPKIMALFPERSGYKFVMIFGSKIPPNLSSFILNKGRRQGFFPTTSSHLKALPSFPFIQFSHPPPLRYNFCHDFWVKNPAKNYGTLSRLFSKTINSPHLVFNFSYLQRSGRFSVQS